MKLNHQQRVKLLCLYRDLKHREETAWGSPLYIGGENGGRQLRWQMERPQDFLSRDVSGRRAGMGTAERIRASKITYWNSQRYTEELKKHPLKVAHKQVFSTRVSRPVTSPQPTKPPIQIRYRETTQSVWMLQGWGRRRDCMWMCKQIARCHAESFTLS